VSLADRCDRAYRHIDRVGEKYDQVWSGCGEEFLEVVDARIPLALRAMTCLPQSLIDELDVVLSRRQNDYRYGRLFHSVLA
jgi:hypothetical protein